MFGYAKLPADWVSLVLEPAHPPTTQESKGVWSIVQPFFSSGVRAIASITYRRDTWGQPNILSTADLTHKDGVCVPLLAPLGSLHTVFDQFEMTFEKYAPDFFTFWCSSYLLQI